MGFGGISMIACSRTHGLLLAVAFALFAADAARAETYDVQGGDLGLGLNSADLTVLPNKCVSIAPPAASDAKPGSHISANIVTSHKELLSSLDLKGSARYGAVSADIAALRSTSFNSDNLYITVSGYITQETHAAGFDIDPAWLDVLKNDPAGFRRKCGDEFLNHELRATRFYLLIKTDTSHIEEVSQLTTGGKYNGALVGGSIGVNALSKLVQDAKSLSIEHTNLPTGIKLPEDNSSNAWFTFTQDVIKKLDEGEIVGDKDGQGRPIFVTSEFHHVPYSLLKSYPDGPAAMSPQELFIQVADEKYVAALDYIDRLDDFLSDPSAGLLPPGKTAASVVDTRAKWKSYANALAIAMKNCSKDVPPNYERCQDDQLPKTTERAEVYLVEHWIDMARAMASSGISMNLGLVKPDQAFCVRSRGTFWADGHERDLRQTLTQDAIDGYKVPGSYFKMAFQDETSGVEHVPDTFGAHWNCVATPDNTLTRIGIQNVHAAGETPGGQRPMVGIIIVPISLKDAVKPGEPN
jgi:hypothetical protein